VVVAFTSGDLDLIDSMLESWTKHSPCTGLIESSHHLLLFYYNREASQDGVLSRFRSWKNLVEHNPLKPCFDRVLLVGRNLSDAEDVYSKNERTKGWVRGPNTLFYSLFFAEPTVSLLTDITAVLWLEPDTVAVREGFLQYLTTRIDDTFDFWIMGSSYRGECALDLKSGECRFLGDHIANHINGNALYRLRPRTITNVTFMELAARNRSFSLSAQPRSFLEFLELVASGPWKEWPFDLAIYRHLFHTLDESMRRQLLHMYVYDDFIRNYGSFPYDPEEVRAAGVYLVHGRYPTSYKKYSESGSLARLEVIPLPPLEIANTAVPQPSSLFLLPDPLSKLITRRKAIIREEELEMYRSAPLIYVQPSGFSAEDKTILSWMCKELIGDYSASADASCSENKAVETLFNLAHQTTHGQESQQTGKARTIMVVKDANSVTDTLEESSCLFTVLRDPIEEILKSYYDFLHSRFEKDPYHTRPAPSLPAFARAESDALLQRLGMPTSCESTADFVREFKARFCAVGISERMKESLVVIQSFLGIPHLTTAAAAAASTGMTSRAQYSEEERRTILLNAPKAIALHRAAQEVLEAQFAALAFVQAQEEATAGNLLSSLLRRTANSRRQVAVTFVSAAYREMFENFVIWALRAQVFNLLFVATDRDAVSFVKQAGFPVYFEQATAIESSSEKGVSGSDNYWSAEFLQVVNHRYELVQRILSLGYEVLVLDLDVVILQNPFSHLSALPRNLDAAFQPDNRVADKGEQTGPPRNKSWTGFANGGVFYIRPTLSAQAFMSALIHNLEMHPDIHDQYILNDQLESYLKNDSINLPLHFTYLHRLLFPNGYAFWDAEEPQSKGVSPLLVHCNWVEGQLTKKYRLREAGLWALDQVSLQQSPVVRAAGVVAAGSELRQNRNNPSRHPRYLAYYVDVAAHGLWNQVNSLRVALSLGQILNRTVILPRIGIYHGSNETRIFDAIFNYKLFSEAFPNHAPHSTLHELFPDWKNMAWLHIAQKYDPDTISAPFKQDNRHNSLLVFRANEHSFLGASETEVRRWFGDGTAFQHMPLLFFDDLFRRFWRFEQDEVESDFAERFERATRPKEDALIAYIAHQARPFNCLHLRRGDFLQEHPEEKDLDSIAKLVSELLPRSEPLYIASDAIHDPLQYTNITAAFRRFFPRVIHLFDFMPYWEAHLHPVNKASTDSRIGILDAEVCARASRFVGNLWSTFSMRICFVRQTRWKFSVPCMDVYGRTLPPEMSFL
jgi:hypothetical protein